jgi:GntR family transcriptional regulator/MocR family aminotransferase
MATVTSLYRYPIKGLSPEPLATITVEPGRPVPMDRVFALARPGAAVDPEHPKWAKKGNFVMLMLDEELAQVQTRLDADTLTLRARDHDGERLGEPLGTAAGRKAVEAFFGALVPKLEGPPRLVHAGDGHFMDKPGPLISLINLATVRSLEQAWGEPLDPLRFRANIYIDGLEPWSEFALVGADIGIGAATFRVHGRNGRCGATNVDPATGARDRDIPGKLRAAFGHKDLGIYLVATGAGAVAVGDSLHLDDAAVVAQASPASAAAPSAGRRFMCRGCYFVYVEDEGRPSEGIAPCTPLDALPASWRCPDCGTVVGNFAPL